MLTKRFSLLASLCVLASTGESAWSKEDAALTTSTHHNKHHSTSAAEASATYCSINKGETGGEKQFSNAHVQTTQDDGDTWDPLDPLIGIGSFEIGDGRHGEYSNKHHLLPGILRKRNDNYDHDHHAAIADSSHDASGTDANDGHAHSHVNSHSHTHNNKRSNIDKHHIRIHERDREHKHVMLGTRDVSQYRVGHAIVDRVGDKRSLDAQYFAKSPSRIMRKMRRDDPSDGTSSDGNGYTRGVQGTIDVMDLDTKPPQIVASLVLSAPVNASSSPDNSSAPFVLDASNTTSSQFTMTEVKPGNETSEHKLVTLSVELFDSKRAANVRYCVSYDPNPPAPKPLVVLPCADNITESTANASDPTVHSRQIFEYLSETGVLSLLWYSPDASPSVDSASQAPVNRRHLGARAASDDGSGSSSYGKVQNVTLVFTPTGPAVRAVQSPLDVAAFEPLDGNNSSTTSENSTASANATNSPNATESAYAYSSSAPISAASGSSTPSAAPSPSPNASTTSVVSMFRAHVATIYAVADESEVPTVVSSTVTTPFTGDSFTSTTDAASDVATASVTPSASASAGSGTADPNVPVDSNSQTSNSESESATEPGASTETSPTSSGVMQMQEADVRVPPTDASDSPSQAPSTTKAESISTSTVTVTVTESGSEVPTSTASMSASASMADGSATAKTLSVERMYRPSV